ncbi:DUF6575 domain-containing protein [Moellerella wisconsensis]|uniref:DUF6575 domain-containing protein n=1 Tax=Moellerella wisconsensis TaxID=158849 RepID=UPI001F4EA86F|nr:DUF6575 domain-containing protein [Moellerella wisconsensis]UNH24282.1 hypothetical protein MNY68_00495 [Moellerella wisconsensis]
MDVFAHHPAFGKLRIINVYLEFDGPKVFYAENETGSTFFVYWVGDDTTFDNWYVIPCSKARIIAFEKEKVSLRSILEYQEQEYFFDIKIPFSSVGKLDIQYKHKNKIAEIILPKSNVYVKKIEIYAPSLLENNLVPTHEIIVSKTNKKSKKNISLEHMSQVCDRFSELVLGFNKSRGVKGSLQALNARYGSFAISLHVEELTKFESFLTQASALMVHKKDIIPLLTQNDIDIKVFLNFLKTIELSNIDFELRSSANKNNIIKIFKLDAEIYLSRLKHRALTYISSIKVPQGNDIEKIFQYIDLKWRNEPITAESLNVEKRLVDYYKYSALILGFLEYNGELTPQGQRIALSDVSTKYRVTAHAFEASECAWAWMNYSEITSLADLDPKTAIDFLTECCPSLSDITIKRRANTLISWCNKLKSHYAQGNILPQKEQE